MRLALETATDRASVALGTSAADALVRELVGARRHAAELLSMIDAVLHERGVGLDAVRELVLSDGPGSFTGLRVGASAAKAIVQARGVALWVAPSLLVRAAGVAQPGATRVDAQPFAGAGQRAGARQGEHDLEIGGAEFVLHGCNHRFPPRR